MNQILIRDAFVVNNGVTSKKSVLIYDRKIQKIDDYIEVDNNCKIIEANGLYLLPGVIDDQVHFREPGLTNKADIETESIAAVAGGVTSFMEMPNTIPNAVSIDVLEDKYKIAESKSVANYSFYLGATNTNIEEIKKINPKTICGLKIFMGSSTGNMLVDNDDSLNEIFKHSPVLIAVHCEDEQTIQNNISKYKSEFGNDIPFRYHPKIRSDEACFLSSQKAVSLAKKHNSRLHILHLSTAKELELLSNESLVNKKITAEVCVHHLWFDDSDYDKYGSLIKWNPAIKSKQDKEALFNALIDGKLDVIATDHAPHLLSEKNNNYWSSPSGGPLVQYSLVAMLEFVHKGKLSIEQIVEKMSHSPAILFNIQERGFIKEGYFADLVLIDLKKGFKVKEDDILSKCKWSPLTNYNFKSSVLYTLVNGNIVYSKGVVDKKIKGMRLSFKR